MVSAQPPYLLSKTQWPAVSTSRGLTRKPVPCPSTPDPNLISRSVTMHQGCFSES